MPYTISINDKKFSILEVVQLHYPQYLGVQISVEGSQSKSYYLILINSADFKIDRQYLKNNFAYEFPNQFIIHVEKYVKMKAFS
jgi:hypothetical protein